MTQAQILAQVDTDFMALKPSIDSFQSGFLNTNSRYWQGLATHSVLPTDGNYTAPDQTSLMPSYETTSWTDTKILPATMCYSLRVDQYDGPQGLGYICILSVTVGTATFDRAVNTGPNTYFDSPWTQRTVAL